MGRNSSISADCDINRQIILELTPLGFVLQNTKKEQTLIIVGPFLSGKMCSNLRTAKNVGVESDCVFLKYSAQQTVIAPGSFQGVSICNSAMLYKAAPGNGD